MALGLALAVVASSTAPIVLLSGELTVIAVSRSFSRAFGIEPRGVEGRSLFELGDGEWNVPQLKNLLTLTATGDAEIDAYEMDLKGARGGDRRLVLSAQKLDYEDPGHVRLLLSVADVTDVRAAEKLKDDLLREKAVLLREVQHRVANSLQIIASVILQSARKVMSTETRTHLTEAHNRVMSVAALQQQLAVSSLGEVELRGYFTQLCASIGASMIHDQNQLTLQTQVDDSKTSADVSVSLGLIVTELVINCLKHAFPDHRSGKIIVGYSSHGPNWTLSVKDDGVGMPPDDDNAMAGLGTSIIQALAKQLEAHVQVTSGHPGTSVAVTHTQIALVGSAVGDSAV